MKITTKATSDIRFAHENSMKMERGVKADIEVKEAEIRAHQNRQEAIGIEWLMAHWRAGGGGEI